MNSKNIETEALEEILKSHSEGHLPILMDIYNPDIVWGDNSLEQENMHLRVINDSNKVRYKGKIYIPCSFDFKAPEEDGKTMGNASINISAIDSRIVQLLRSIDLICEVTVIASFAKSGTVYQFYELAEYKFKMKNASYTRTSASLTLQSDDVWSLSVPRDTATKDRLPSYNDE